MMAHDMIRDDITKKEIEYAKIVLLVIFFASMCIIGTLVCLAKFVEEDDERNQEEHVIIDIDDDDQFG